MYRQAGLSRRHFIELCAAGAGAALLAACAPKATPAPKEAPAGEAAPAEKKAEAPKAAEGQKVLIFVGFGTGTSESQIAEETALVEECNETLADQGITAELMVTPHEEHLAKFSAMLAAGTPPDIVMPIGVGGVAELYDTDAWLDLQPMIERDQYDMSDFYGSTVTLHTYSTTRSCSKRPASTRSLTPGTTATGRSTSWSRWGVSSRWTRAAIRLIRPGLTLPTSCSGAMTSLGWTLQGSHVNSGRRRRRAFQTTTRRRCSTTRPMRRVLSG